MKLVTERLEMRPADPEDAGRIFSAIQASRKELEPLANWPKGVASESDCRKFLEAQDGSRQEFSIFEGKEFVGGGALVGKGCAEIKLWMRSSLWGRGLGSEAARALARHAIKTDGAHKVFARIDPANRASRKVLMKTGFKYEGCLREEKELMGKWVNQECWGLLASEAPK